MNLKLHPLCKLSIAQCFTKLIVTIMSSSSLIMVHLAPCLQELFPFVREKNTIFYKKKNTPFLKVSDSLSLTMFNP